MQNFWCSLLQYWCSVNKQNHNMVRTYSFVNSTQTHIHATISISFFFFPTMYLTAYCDSTEFLEMIIEDINHFEFLIIGKIFMRA